jgi:signal transduction histidine kinase
LIQVPMQVKDQVIGVLQVLNKRDRSPFTWDDLELMNAFASQAAVTLENARLYTLTDKALAERVEELSVLQRIAHDLNADLDLERVMHITLDWSMAQSKAAAGLVGILDGDAVQVMDWRGYPDGMFSSEKEYLPLDLAIWKEALQESTEAAVSPNQKATGRLRKRIDVTNGGQNALGGNNPGLLPGGKSSVVVPIRRKGGVIGVILLESTSRAGFSSETQAFLSRMSDQAAIAISNAQLYAGIQMANIAKSQFVSSAAHELKNPLTSIKGYSDLVIGGAVGPVTEGQTRFLTTIRSNAERMSTLVSDLQDISRIEAGQLRLQYSVVAISEIIDEVVRTLRKQIDEKEQDLRLDFSAGLSPVWCDNTRLIQILTNLISNASKYTPRCGSICIQAEQSANFWDPGGAGQVVHFSVQDSGIGISPEDQKKIFQQFFRSEDPKVREVTGTGLGLSITKNLVEMQGGKIWFTSLPDHGTAFHFTIPVAETGNNI